MPSWSARTKPHHSASTNSGNDSATPRSFAHRVRLVTPAAATDPGILADCPHQLYAPAEDGSFVLLESVDVSPRRRDPRGLLLTEAAIWRQIPEGPPVPLGSLAGVGAARDADGSFLWTLWRGGSLRGGLLLSVPGERPRLPRAVRTALSDPLVQTCLALRIDALLAARARDELLVFRAAVGKTLPYAFLGLDEFGRVAYLGGHAREILGLSPAHAIGSDCARVFRPVGLEKNPLSEALRGRAAPFEMYLAREDGSEIPISLQIARSPRSLNQRGLVAFFRDLSEERALADTVSQRDRLAALGELSAGIAHEIRNPLTGIANCAQVLKEGRGTEESRQRFLEIILEEAARLNRIVEGLLRYARPHRPELREADVVDSVRRVLELESQSMEDRGIRSTLRARPQLPRLFMDPAQIEQVLLNLVRNAIEAMPDGGELKVELSVVQRARYRRQGAGRRATDRVGFAPRGPKSRWLEIKISDTGGGIPKELLSRIWNPFFTTRPRGTGLGLSLSLSIVREHGGTLTARSVERKGTTMLLDLPIERRQGERRNPGR